MPMKNRRWPTERRPAMAERRCGPLQSLWFYRGVAKGNLERLFALAATVEESGPTPFAESRESRIVPRRWLLRTTVTQPRDQQLRR
jgi:hypothetical protein